MDITEKALRRLVEYLFQIIDDIDTAGDIAKSDDKAFRRLVEQYQKKRWETGIDCDGYTLDLEPAIQKFSETQSDEDYAEFERKLLEKEVYDKVCMDLAWELPPHIVMWAFYRVLAHATTGDHGNISPVDLTGQEAADFWSKEVVEPEDKKKEKDATAVPVSEYMDLPKAKKFVKSRLVKPTDRDIALHRDFFISPEGHLYWSHAYQHGELEDAIKIVLGYDIDTWLVEDKGWSKLQSAYAKRGSTEFHHARKHYTQKQLDTLWDMALTYKKYDKRYGETMAKAINETIQKSEKHSANFTEAQGTRDTYSLEEPLDWNQIGQTLKDFQIVVEEVESWKKGLERQIQEGSGILIDEIIDPRILGWLKYGDGGRSGHAGEPLEDEGLYMWIQENFGRNSAVALHGITVPQDSIEMLDNFIGRDVISLFPSALKYVETLLQPLYRIRDGLNHYMKQAGTARFNYKGLNIYNPDLLADPLAHEMLAYLDRLLYLLKERDLEKIFKSEIKGVTIRLATDADGKSNAYYDKPRQWIVLLHRMLDKDIVPRIGNDWPLEVVVHEFGHHLHMNFLNPNARAFWDDPWKELQRAFALQQDYIVSQKDRTYFYNILKRRILSDQHDIQTAFKRALQEIKSRGDRIVKNAYKKYVAWLYKPSPALSRAARGKHITKDENKPVLTQAGIDFLSGMRKDFHKDHASYEYALGQSIPGDYPVMKSSDELDELLQGHKSHDELVKALDLPTDYAAENELEDFAETFTTYMLNPKQLSPTARYRLMRALSLSGVHGKPVMRLSKKDLSELGLAEVTEKGIHFATGKPVTFPYMRNTESSPNMGSRFGQHIEPAGRYLTYSTNRSPDPLPNWEYGEVTFRKPLVLSLAHDENDIYGPTGWKQRLFDVYKKKGKALSRALIRDGYDGIVTVQKKWGVTSEIVDLTVFKNAATQEKTAGSAHIEALRQIDEDHYDDPVGSYKKTREYLKSIRAKRLGEGFGRTVWDLGDGTVLKLAYNQLGRRQNQAEADIWDYEGAKLLLPVLASSDYERWVMMPRAKPLQDDESMRPYFGEVWYTFIDFIAGYKMNNKQLQELKQERDLFELGKIVKRYKLAYRDIYKSLSWGKYQGKVKIFDYGLDNASGKKMEHLTKSYR